MCGVPVPFISRCIWDIVKKISRSCTLNSFQEIDFENRPFLQKEKKIIFQKISDRHERNFEVSVVIIGGICVSKINNLADKL